MKSKKKEKNNDKIIFLNYLNSLKKGLKDCGIKSEKCVTPKSKSIQKRTVT